MSKADELETRLLIIERKQKLLFETLKQGKPSLAHHWKRAADWVAKYQSGIIPPVDEEAG